MMLALAAWFVALAIGSSSTTDYSSGGRLGQAFLCAAPAAGAIAADVSIRRRDSR